MSNREIVMDLVAKLPEDASLEEIAGVRTAREQAQLRQGIPADDARKLVDVWGGQQSS